MWLVLPLCLLLSLTEAFASGKTGSITLTVTDRNDLPVSGLSTVIYYVADPNGVSVDSFRGAELKPQVLLDTRNNAKNAQFLQEYVAAHKLEGDTRQTDGLGQVVYAGLNEGIYLVLCGAGQSEVFNPFLLYIPTKIGNFVVYDVNSAPKTEPGEYSDPEPTNSPEPSSTPEPTGTPEPTDSPEPTDTPGTNRFCVRYSYSGDVPENAPLCPEDRVYDSGTVVAIYGEPSVEGYLFYWSYDPLELPSSAFAPLSAEGEGDGIGIVRLNAYRLAVAAREKLTAESFIMPANDVHIVGVWQKDSSGPDQPDLPQTGLNRRPAYILLGLGFALVLAGGIDLWVNRRKRND